MTAGDPEVERAGRYIWVGAGRDMMPQHVERTNIQNKAKFVFHTLSFLLFCRVYTVSTRSLGQNTELCVTSYQCVVLRWVSDRSSIRHDGL